jgi:histidinol phosphatase-like enzyme
VHECKRLKPAFGIVFDALRAESITPDDANVYVIRDRATDVQVGLNMNGIGVLVPFENEPGEDEKVKKLKGQTRIHIAHDLLDAAGFIVAREK